MPVLYVRFYCVSQQFPTFVYQLVQPRGQLAHEAFSPPNLVPLHIGRLKLNPSSVDSIVGISTFESASARNLGVREIARRCRSRVRNTDERISLSNFPTKDEYISEMARFPEPVSIWEPVLSPQNQNRTGSEPVPIHAVK